VEDRSASTFMVKQSTQRRLLRLRDPEDRRSKICCNLGHYLQSTREEFLDFLTLKMEALLSSETSVIPYQPTQCNILEDLTVRFNHFIS
jgi:hypothetical protein